MRGKRHGTEDQASVLSERLNGAFRRPGEADWLDVRRRAGENRAHLSWSRHRVLLVTGVLVLAAGACAGSVGVVPWLNRHPATVKAPSLAPPCRAKNLWVRLDYGVSLNGLDGGLELVNNGSRACSLVGSPRLALIDPRVSVPRLFVEYTPPVPPSPGSLGNLTPRSLLRAIPPHQAAYLGFSWNNWCGPGSAPGALELRLPNGERIARSFSTASPPASQVQRGLSATAPRCYRKRWQTALHYGSFYPGWTPKSVISSYQLRSVLPLRASVITKGLPTIRKKWIGPSFINQPGAINGRYFTYLRVKRGAVFHFRVALRNTSKRPFRFAKCPLYSEIFSTFPGLHEEAFVLNCDSAGTIAPGKLAFFAMELNVPKTASLGKSFLSWRLIDGNRGSGVLPMTPIWIVS